MPQAVTEDFRKTLRSTPHGKIKSGTEFDELYSAMETSENPLDRTVQLIAEFHGPWSGGSVELTDFSSYIASALRSVPMVQQAMQTANQALDAVNAVQNLIGSSVGKQSPLTCAIMPAALLREFLNRAQKLHPAINMYIQMNINSFPYFQQISEDIGSFASIVMNQSSIDPMMWPLQNGVGCLETNSRMNINTFLKMAEDIFNLMDNANNLTNTLFLRSMAKQNNMAFMHPQYSKERPIAHGHNFTMDVFNAARNISAMAPCLAAILSLAGDVIRLINKFLCLKELTRYRVEGFEISMNEGPNGEPVTYIVDQSSRPMYDTEKGNDLTDPTNERVLGAKFDYKNEIS
jgi:hypothetical protein